MSELPKPNTPKKAAVALPESGIHKDETVCSVCCLAVNIRNKKHVKLFGKTNTYLKVENALGIKMDKSIFEGGICCRKCINKCNTILSTRREMTESLSNRGRQKRLENFTPEKDATKKTKPLFDFTPKSINFDDNTSTTTLAANVMQVSSQLYHIQNMFFC
jgi:hypothetical protein